MCGVSPVLAQVCRTFLQHGLPRTVHTRALLTLRDLRSHACTCAPAGGWQPSPECSVVSRYR
eukprot:3646972-Alexandrium_andersonii.AAC.1